MKTSLVKICLTLSLGLLPLFVGCGRADKAQVIGGVTEDFLVDLQASQAAYAQQMGSIHTSKVKSKRAR